MDKEESTRLLREARDHIIAHRRDDALRLYERLSEEDVPPSDRRYAISSRACMLGGRGEREQALALREQAAALAARISPQEVADEALDAGVMWFRLLDLEEALTAFQQAAMLAQVAGAGKTMGYARMNVALVQLHARRWDEAEESLRQAERLFAEAGLPDHAVMAHQNIGCVLLHSGQFDRARAHLDEAWGRLASPVRQNRNLYVHLVAQDASLASREGDIPRARLLANMVLGAGRYRHIAYGVLARCAARESRFDEAAQHLEAARQAAHEEGSGQYLLLLEHIAVEVGNLRSEKEAFL